MPIPLVFHRLFRRLAILLFAGLTSMLWVPDSPWSDGLVVRAQENQTVRLISRERGMPIDPIQEVSFEEGDEPVLPGVTLNAGDDWLKNLPVTIKNVSIMRRTSLESKSSFFFSIRETVLKDAHA
jgi:hypothetical protein